MNGEPRSWRELATRLEEHGVPRQRSKIVALLHETDATYEEVAETLGVESRGSIGNQVRAYRERLKNSQWLAAHAPEV